MDEKELTADIGDAIYRVLRNHGIEPKDVGVVIDPMEIRVLVRLPIIKGKLKRLKDRFKK